MLAGLTAAESYGLRGWPSGEVHVLVPYDCDVADLPGVRIHRTRQWRAHTGRPPRSPAADALVDAATWARTDAAAAGLPPPVRQAVRTDASGRRRSLDADLGRFAVEIDGMPHLEVRRHAADLHRQNDLALADERILRFSALSVRTDGAAVVRQLRRAKPLWG